MAPAALALSLLLASSGPIAIRWAPGTLHGFPSLSDQAGRILADGELTQVLRGEDLLVHVQWKFADGLRADERDEFRVGAALVQKRFSWVETRGGEELRRFEVDFATGQAIAVRRHRSGELARDEERLELPTAGAFAGYGTALAVEQLEIAKGAETELAFVAFTPKPRVVTLGVRKDGEERLAARGRGILCDRFTLHPKIPFPVSLLAGAKDAHLWFTHAEPPALVRAEQNLAAKDDPQVLVDVIPRGAAHPPVARRGKARERPPSR